MRRLLLVFTTLVLGGCLGGTTEVTDTPSDPATETFASSLNINIAQMQKTANGVYYKDVTVGTGATLTSTSGIPLTTPKNITIAYNGFLKNGALFDTSSDLTGQTATFDLSGAVVGFQDGMLGMNIGGERVMVIPSGLAYGPATVTGRFGTIPPNSTLVFDVKLVDLP